MNSYPLFNIDSSLIDLHESDVTAEIIEARIISLSFKNFDFMERKLPFVIECCTHNRNFWLLLVGACKNVYLARKESAVILVFPQNKECGYIRIYRFRPNRRGSPINDLGIGFISLPNEEKLYELLDTDGARYGFEAWAKHKTQATKLPTELIAGRMQNTSVDRGIILTRGDGCVVCGEKASCYAATSIGDIDQAVMIQLPVCRSHLEEAKRQPSIFSFLASLFSLKLDWEEIEKLPYIPDELIPFVHLTVAEELRGKVRGATKTERGWEIWIELQSGWKWLLRIGCFTDFAYMLFEPGVKKERYRSDAAPDHPELNFFPIHEHSKPDRKGDSVTPSFLYGHPFFDLKRFKNIGEQLGAY